ncbi:MAG: hypothetical protein WCJ30_27085, partial [Deltaproteobacteria bacterium]
MRHTLFSMTGLIAALTAAAPACLNTAVLASASDGSQDANADAADVHDLDDHADATGDGPVANVHIDGTIEAMNEGENAQTAAGFETRVTLRIARAGAAIEHAVVTVTGAGVTTTLAQVGGTFVGSLHGYAAGYTLDIAGDGVTAHDIALAGPTFHTFTTPTVGQTVRAGSPLTVTWSPSGAQAATIESDAMPETAIPDTGRYTIPGSILAGEPGQVD